MRNAVLVVAHLSVNKRGPKHIAPVFNVKHLHGNGKIHIARKKLCVIAIFVFQIAVEFLAHIKHERNAFERSFKSEARARPKFQFVYVARVLQVKGIVPASQEVTEHERIAVVKFRTESEILLARLNIFF